MVFIVCFLGSLENILKLGLIIVFDSCKLSVKYHFQFVSLNPSPISPQPTKSILVHAQLDNLRKDREPRYYRSPPGTTGCNVQADISLLKLACPVLPRAARYYREPRVSHINFQVVRCEGLFPTRTIHSQNRRPLFIFSGHHIVAAGFGLPRLDLLRGSLPLLDLLHGLRYLTRFFALFGFSHEP